MIDIFVFAKRGGVLAMGLSMGLQCDGIRSSSTRLVYDFAARSCSKHVLRTYAICDILHSARGRALAISLGTCSGQAQRNEGGDRQ